MKKILKNIIKDLIIKEFNLKNNIKNFKHTKYQRLDSFGCTSLIISIEKYFKINLDQKLVIQMTDEKSINKILKKIIK